MIFVVVFSALVVAMAAFSAANAQIASNQQKVGSALASASSGLEVQRYWLARVMIPSSTPPADYFSTIVDTIQTDLADSNITNVTLNSGGTIPAVVLDSSTQQQFDGQLLITDANPNLMRAYTRGGNDQVTRTIGVAFDIEPYEHPIFNYGLATKGPLCYTGNPTMTVTNEAWEADMYIESSGSPVALFVGGNTKFAGDVLVGNPLANVDFGGDVLIGGEHGEPAIDNHVLIGVAPVEFPTPDTARFRTYATSERMQPDWLSTRPLT